MHAKPTQHLAVVLWLRVQLGRVYGTWVSVVAIGLLASVPSPGAAPSYLSHPPMRPLPLPSHTPREAGPAFFVDPVKGDDSFDGAQASPWKTIARALKQLKAGDTLYLRGGIYYESVMVALVGTAEQPITLRGYPKELAVLDAGIRVFNEDPAHAWEPVANGADGEFRSTISYRTCGGIGNFADSMVPLQRYMTISDLRSTNELFSPKLGNRADDPTDIYAGPGVRRDPETGHIHIRLVHTKLAGLGDLHYRGETDPRKLPLVIAGHDYALRIDSAKHLRIRDLVIRGAQRATVTISNSENIELSGLTIYSGQSALRTSSTRGLRLLDSSLRGFGAPWHSRFHHKDRSGAGYLVAAVGDGFEFAHCEFTDHHDFLQCAGVDNLRFHHNLVDNFNDDGIEPGPKREHGKMLIYQNYITRCLSPFTLHGKKPNPVTGEPGSGVYIYRNVVDLRRGTYSGPPSQPDPSGAFLSRRTELLAHDHGSPTHPIYYVYHNTFLLQSLAFRGYYAFGWGAHTAGTTRRVFNNIFVQAEGIPGLNFTAISADDDFQADGNLFWGMKDGQAYRGDDLGKFRRSAVFISSKNRYVPGWCAHDLFADPKFQSLAPDGGAALDLRLRPDSPAIDAGVELSPAWPDPMRKTDQGKPDLGAFPLGAEPLQVGRQRAQ
jgi:hypothetical protein